MASRDDIIIEITPQVLLKAYTCGIFPMAESAEDPALYWIEPQQRGILQLDRVHVPKRLARTRWKSLRAAYGKQEWLSRCFSQPCGPRTAPLNVGPGALTLSGRFVTRSVMGQLNREGHAKLTGPRSFA